VSVDSSSVSCTVEGAELGTGRVGSVGIGAIGPAQSISAKL
jgi:hypothetical protein